MQRAGLVGVGKEGEQEGDVGAGVVHVVDVVGHVVCSGWLLASVPSV